MRMSGWTDADSHSLRRRPLATIRAPLKKISLPRGAPPVAAPKLWGARQLLAQQFVLARGAARGSRATGGAHQGARRVGRRACQGACGLAQVLAQTTVLAQGGTVSPMGHRRAPCAAADLRAVPQPRASIRPRSKVTLR